MSESDHPATGSRAAIYRITLTIPADDTTRDDHRPIRTRPPHEIVAALCGFGDPGELEYVEEPQVTPDRATIEVSEESADWITAKAMESGCTEDEVIAALIRSWDDECYA